MGKRSRRRASGRPVDTAGPGCPSHLGRPVGACPSCRETAEAVRTGIPTATRGPVPIADAPRDPPPAPTGPAGVLVVPDSPVEPANSAEFEESLMRAMTEPIDPDGPDRSCFATPMAGSTPPEAGAELPELLPSRLLRWMDRATSGPIGDLQNALVDQGWSILPPNDEGRPYATAFPPGAQPTSGCPRVPLPATLDSERETRNTVAALRRAGPFEWEGR